MSGSWDPVAHDDPWAPIAHEDVEPDKEPDKAKKSSTSPSKPKAAVKEKTADEPAPTTMPLGMSLIVPQDMAQAVNAIAAGQKEVVAEITGAKAMFSEFSENMITVLDALRTSDEDADANRAEVLEQMQGHADAHSAGQSELLAAVNTLSENLKGWTDAIVAAIAAPRRVSLERDQNGNAVAAVSQTGEA